MRTLSAIYNDYFSSTAVFSYREDERIFRTRFMRTWFVILLILVVLMHLGSMAGIGANEYHYFIMNLIQSIKQLSDELFPEILEISDFWFQGQKIILMPAISMSPPNIFFRVIAGICTASFEPT